MELLFGMRQVLLQVCKMLNVLLYDVCILPCPVLYTERYKLPHWRYSDMAGDT